MIPIYSDNKLTRITRFVKMGAVRPRCITALGDNLQLRILTWALVLVCLNRSEQYYCLHRSLNLIWNTTEILNTFNWKLTLIRSTWAVLNDSCCLVARLSKSCICVPLSVQLWVSLRDVLLLMHNSWSSTTGRCFSSKTGVTARHDRTGSHSTKPTLYDQMHTPKYSYRSDMTVLCERIMK